MMDDLNNGKETSWVPSTLKLRMETWQYRWHKLNLGSPWPLLLVGLGVGILCVVSPVLAIIACLVGILFYSALSRPMLLCYLVVAATMLTSGIERGRFIPLFSINEVVLAFSVLIGLIIILTDSRRKMVFPGYFWAAFITLVGGTVIAPIGTFLIMGTQLTISNAFKIVAPLQYFLLFWLFASIPQSEADRRKIMHWMLAFGALVAVVGLAQAARIGIVDRLLGTLFSSSHESAAAQAGRITSLLGSWNTLGIYMMTIIFMCWALLFEEENTRGRVFILGILGLALLCLLASGSYAGLIGMVIGIVFMQIINPMRVKSFPVLIGVCVGLILLVLIFWPLLQPMIETRFLYQTREGGVLPQTLTFRFQIWQQVFLPPIRLHFPWPVYPSVPINYAWQYEESQYILLLFRTGLIGLLGYVAWIGVTIGWLRRRFRSHAGLYKAIASTAMTLVVVLVIAGFTNEVFSFAGTIDYLWIMLALVANPPLESTQTVSEAM
jgi:hypothetical protein